MGPISSKMLPKLKFKMYFTPANKIKRVKNTSDFKILMTRLRDYFGQK